MRLHQHRNRPQHQNNAGYIASLKTTQASQAQRTPDQEEKQQTQANTQNPFVQLFGLEETYNAYLRYKQKSREAQGHYSYKTDSQQAAPQSTLDAAQAQKQQLEAQLCAQGFNGITDFENQLQSYIVEFERETAEIALAHLSRYESQLQQQAERYSDTATVADLHKGLSNFRHHQHTTEKHQAERTAYNRSQGLAAMTGTRTFDKVHADSATKEKQHRAAATEQLATNAQCHPIVAESAPSPRANLDRSELASATTPKQLGEYLQAHIAARLRDIQNVRADLAKNLALIYQMDSLLSAAYPLLGVEKGSIHEQLIQTRKGKLENQHTIDLLFASVLAVALSVGSMGTGAPAALMGVGAFGISSHLAYEEYQHYEQQNAASGSGLASQDPSIAWLVVSVLAAGLDLAVAAKAIKAISPLAKSLEATGDLSAFEQGLRVLEEVGKIDRKIVVAAREAAKGRAIAKEAQEELSRLLAGRLQSGPVIDPVVYKQLMRKAYGMGTDAKGQFKKFYLVYLRDRKLQRLKDLPAEELAKLKNAFEDGRNFRNSLGIEGNYPKLNNWLFEESIPLECRSRMKYWTDDMKKELERAFGRTKYDDLIDDLKNPTLMEAMEIALRNPENAWGAIKEAGENITVAVQKLAQSQFFKYYVAEGKAFEKLVTKELPTVEPFKSFLEKGFQQLNQIYLKGDELMVVVDNLLVKLEMDAWGDEFFRGIINESKLNRGTGWTWNQKKEILKRFENTTDEYLEFELRSSNKILGDQNAPEGFDTGIKLRIYRSDIYKTTSDGNGKIGKTSKIF